MRLVVLEPVMGSRHFTCKCPSDFLNADASDMNKQLCRVLTSTAAAALLTAASTAYSQMYRWVDDRGATNYSDQLPADRAGIRRLTEIENGSRKATRSEQRTREILEAEGLLNSGMQRDASGTYAPHADGNSELPLTQPEASASSAFWGEPAGKAEAVRDPCLRSSDPRCHERHRAAYVPGRGYSPSALRETREAAASGIGSTTGSASATLSGGAPRRVKLEAPKASNYALPPGNTLPLFPVARR